MAAVQTAHDAIGRLATNAYIMGGALQILIQFFIQMAHKI